MKTLDEMAEDALKAKAEGRCMPFPPVVERPAWTAADNAAESEERRFRKVAA